MANRTLITRTVWKAPDASYIGRSWQGWWYLILLDFPLIIALRAADGGVKGNPLIRRKL